MPKLKKMNKYLLAMGCITVFMASCRVDLPVQMIVDWVKVYQ